MVKPNFFIVGAPKCGTTALYSYLADHENIFLPSFKEPHYFADGMDESRSYISDLSEYLSLFRKSKQQHTAVGEASVFYLSNEGAINNIYGFNQNARLIAMVRNPVDMLHSFHNQMLFRLTENVEDFEQAWNLQEERKRGNNVPDTCADPSLLQYRQLGQLGRQVERMLKIFPRKQVKILLFDDFVKSPESSYREALEHLDIPFDGRKHFPKINESKVPRSKFLTSFIQSPPKGIRFLVNVVKKVSGKTRTGLAAPLLALNTKKFKRSKIRPEFRQQILHDFEMDIQLLSKLIGKDLSHWFDLHHVK